MSTPFVVLALLGLLTFVGALGVAAWAGQTPAGRWRPGAWRWLLLAAAGCLLMLCGLHYAGSDGTGLWFPGWREPPLGDRP